MAMTRYERELALMRRIHPRLPQRHDLEKRFVDAWLAAAPGGGRRRVLDAGCGFQYGLVVQYRDRLWSFGVDLDLDTVRKNRDLDAKGLADLGRLPLRPGSVDLIFCRDVLEHMHDPGAGMAEFFRVLKPGGAVVLSTVNVRNPGMWSVRFVPRWLRKMVRSASFGAELGDNAPTFYRANTREQIRAVLEKEGFVVSGFDFYPAFASYFRFSTPLLLAFTAMNRVLDQLGLAGLYGGILVTAIRPAAGDRG